VRVDRLIALVGLAIPLALAGCGGSSGSSENYLYVNVVAEGGANDQIAIIDARSGSATFGKILRLIDLGSKYNEPHHTGRSPDGKTGYFMGLFLPGRIWSLDLTMPVTSPDLKPVTLVDDSAKKVGYNNPDEFVGLPDGRFMVSFMGSAAATAPGAIVMFDGPAGNMMAKFEVSKTDTSSLAYNPHGFDYRSDIGRIANGNFMMPADAAGLLGKAPGSTFRSGLTVWNFSSTMNTASVLKTVNLNPNNMAMHDGIMDVKMIPNDPMGRVFATNMRGGEIWLVSTMDPFTATTVVTGLMYPQLIQMTKDGKTMYVTTYIDNTLHKYDISDPTHPKELGNVVGPQPPSLSGTPSGAHYCKLSTDEQRIYVTSYFVTLSDDVQYLINNGTLPKGTVDMGVDFHGNRQLWGATTTDMKLLPNFDVDFSGTSIQTADGTMLSGGAFGGHGIILDK
jgi:selenium-binding protein 1